MWPSPAPVAPPPRPAPSQPALLALGGSNLPPASFADWIADSRASFHTTPYASILTSTHPPSPSCPSSIIVGDGSAHPVTSVGDSILPGSFRLHNVLVAPNIIHNLLSVRQFTIDNSCSIEFDPSGLFVKDLTSRQLLYTLRLPAASTSLFPPLPHALATTASSVTWHRRLGHPGADALSKLSCSSAISCTQGTHEYIYHACQLGRHVLLPFASSTS